MKIRKMALYPVVIVLLGISIACDSIPDAQRTQGAGNQVSEQKSSGAANSSPRSEDREADQPKQSPSNQTPKESSNQTPQEGSGANKQVSVQVQASCLSGRSFNLSLRDTDNNSSSQSSSPFPGCERIAAKLNGQTYPKGIVKNILSGGPIIQAACFQGTFNIQIQYNGSSSQQSVSLSSEAACFEMRDAINEEKI